MDAAAIARPYAAAAFAYAREQQAVAPIVVEPAEFGPDAAVMAMGTAVVLALAFTMGKVTRTAGVAMITLYAAYIVLLYAGPIS